MRADHRALRIPVKGLRAHALHEAAADQAQDVELMRALPERDAAAERLIELFRAARTVDPIAVVDVVEQPRASEFAARDQLAHRPVRFVVAV